MVKSLGREKFLESLSPASSTALAADLCCWEYDIAWRLLLPFMSLIFLNCSALEKSGPASVFPYASAMWYLLNKYMAMLATGHLSTSRARRHPAYCGPLEMVELLVVIINAVGDDLDPCGSNSYVLISAMHTSRRCPLGKRNEWPREKFTKVLKQVWGFTSSVLHSQSGLRSWWYLESSEMSLKLSSDFIEFDRDTVIDAIITAFIPLK